MIGVGVAQSVQWPGQESASGFRFSERGGIFSLRHRVQTGSGPAIQWTLVTPSPGVKRSRGENDRSPLYKAEIKNVWSYTSTSPYAFVAMY
jgi:hypothetical protein